MSVGEDILGLELSDLEDSAQELALPYLRIASLIKKYVFEEDIPQIYLDNREFSQLLEYLDLASPDSHIARASGAGAMEEDPHEANLSICDGLNWFHPKGEEVGGGSNNELTLWCQNFFPMINSHCGAAQKLLQVNLLWQQPSLLKVPKNYDEIFEVRTTEMVIIGGMLLLIPIVHTFSSIISGSVPSVARFPRIPLCASCVGPWSA